MIILLITYLIGGLLLILLSLPLLYDKVPPNSFYGFRIAKTMSDPRIWYAANRYSARWLIAAGIVVVIVAVLFYFLPGISLTFYANSCMIVALLTLTVGLVASSRYIRTL